MLTRTIAPELSKRGVFVTSVDTGWVSRMRPGEASARVPTPPLSVEDGAARVLDPVLTGVLESETPAFGCLLRDFKAAQW